MRTSSSPSSFIAFDRAVIASALDVTDLDRWVDVPNFSSNYSFVASVTVHSETVDDPTIAYNGQWSSQEGSTPGRSIHVTTRLGDSAQLTFNGRNIHPSPLRVSQLTFFIQGLPSLSMDVEIPRLAITMSPSMDRRRNMTPSRYGMKAPCCFTRPDLIPNVRTL